MAPHNYERLLARIEKDLKNLPSNFPDPRDKERVDLLRDLLGRIKTKCEQAANGDHDESALKLKQELDSGIEKIHTKFENPDQQASDPPRKRKRTAVAASAQGQPEQATKPPAPKKRKTKAAPKPKTASKSVSKSASKSKTPAAPKHSAEEVEAANALLNFRSSSSNHHVFSKLPHLSKKSSKEQIFLQGVDYALRNMPNFMSRQDLYDFVMQAFSIDV